MEMSKDVKHTKSEPLPEVNTGYADDGSQQQSTGNYNQSVQQQPQAYNESAGQPPPPYASPSVQQQSSSNVTVVMQQPVKEERLLLGSVYGHREWTTGLCDCSDDPSDCCFTCCCYGLMMWQIAGRMGETGCAPCCVPFFDISIRTRIRTLGGIKGTMYKDCLTVCCCQYCSACQESRELKIMGL